LSIAYTLFSTTRSTAESGASRRRVGEVSLSSGRRDLSGSNGGDEGRASREDRVQVVLGAIRISSSVSTGVTRSRDHGNSTKTELLEFCVDTLNVDFVGDTQLLAFSTTNTILALSFLVPTVRDGVHKRNILGGEHVGGEPVEPDRISLNPEPTSSHMAYSKNVLNIKSGFDLRIGRIVLSNNVVGGNRGNANIEFRSKVSKISRREVLIFELNNSDGRVLHYLSGTSLVDNLDGLRGNGDGNFRRLSRLLVGKSRSGELTKSSNHVYVLGNFVREAERTELTNEFLSCLVLEQLELSVQQL
jgi:hypothetical protein